MTDGRRAFEATIRDPIIVAALIAFVVVAGIWFGILFSYPATTWDRLEGLYIEFGGAIFDIVIFGLAVTAVSVWLDKKSEIQRYRETIEDYKRWGSEEAGFRLAGAMRRLAQLGITDFDLTGVRLKKFAFQYHGIMDISGSTFFDGTWGQPGKMTQVKLEDVSFSYANCSNVLFSPFDPMAWLPGNPSYRHAEFIDCSFMNCDLSNATFRGALLKWDNAPPKEQGYWEEDEEGRPGGFVRENWGPFDGAKLEGAIFADVHFVNADFRQAEGILRADFAGATGLENAYFDNEETKTKVLAMAGLKKSSFKKSAL